MFGFGKKHHRRRRRSNPMLPIPGGEFGKGIAGVLVGGFGCRIIPENVPYLSQYNNGWMGYGLNLLATLGLAKLARWAAGPKAEEGAWYGGILATGSRFVSDRFGKTIVQFGAVRIGNDPAFNFRRFGKYQSAADVPLSPLPVPTTYPASGPVPPLPVGTSLAPKMLPATAGAAKTQPSTIAAASSMGWYGRSKYGSNRFM